jgi:hypothetical protein
MGLLDNLVMLLSTDWFKPYWGAIGIILDDSKKNLMQQGCRQIVSQIISGAGDYWSISFSRDRYRETRARLDSLSKTHGTEEAVIGAIEEWSALSDEDMKAGSLFESLTEDLFFEGSTLPSYALDVDLKVIISKVRDDQWSIAINGADLSSRSKSSWDRYIRELTPDLPTYLADTLFSFLRAQHFKACWTLIVNRATKEQHTKLVAWYKAMAKLRAKREIGPSYFR